MAKRFEQGPILGISVGAELIDAVLLRWDGGRYRFVAHFTRPRRLAAADIQSDSMDQLLPGLQGGSDSDYTLEIGGNGGSEGVYLDSELTGLKPGRGELAALGEKRVRTSSSTPFFVQIRQILDDAARHGGKSPLLAFCAAPPDVGYAVVEAIDEGKKAGPFDFLTGKGSQNRERLAEVERQVGVPVDRKRIFFLPLGQGNGTQAELAVAGLADDSIVRTVESLTSDKRGEGLQIAAIEGELTLHVSLLLRSVEKSGLKRTLLVHVGTEDMLTVFASGARLSHFDRTRSVTVFDTPETIGSRLLLQLDQRKVDDVDQVYVLASSHSETLLRTFEQIFPDALVRSYDQLLEEAGLDRPERVGELQTGPALAAAVGLRVAPGYPTERRDYQVNLLPKGLASTSRKRQAIAWHTWLMLPLLFGLTWYFVTAYFDNQAHIEQRRLELQINPAAPPIANPAVVQARIDSVQRVYLQHTRSLKVLDSLLLGSDRWSRVLERVSMATADLSGVWLESCRPSSNNLTIQGRALSRTRVSQFARRMDASIERVAAVEIKDETKQVTVYEFRLTAPIPTEIPEVSKYLQERARSESGNMPVN